MRAGKAILIEGAGTLLDIDHGPIPTSPRPTPGRWGLHRLRHSAEGDGRVLGVVGLHDARWRGRFRPSYRARWATGCARAAASTARSPAVRGAAAGSTRWRSASGAHQRPRRAETKLDVLDGLERTTFARRTLRRPHAHGVSVRCQQLGSASRSTNRCPAGRRPPKCAVRVAPRGGQELRARPEEVSGMRRSSRPIGTSR